MIELHPLWSLYLLMLNQCHLSYPLYKASGADGLSAQFIRASPYMVRLVTVLINKCIESFFSGSRLLLHLCLSVNSA